MNIKVISLIMFFILFISGCSSDFIILDTNINELIFNTSLSYQESGVLISSSQNISNINRNITFYYDSSDSTRVIYYTIVTGNISKNVTVNYIDNNETISGILVEDI